MNSRGKKILSMVLERKDILINEEPGNPRQNEKNINISIKNNSPTPELELQQEGDKKQNEYQQKNSTLLSINSTEIEDNISNDATYLSSGSEFIPDVTDDESDQEDNAIPSTSTAKIVNELDLEDEDNTIPLKNNADGIIVSFGKFCKTNSTSVEQYSNVRPWTKKSLCPYCFDDVTHFPRHLQRHHEDQGAVREFLCLPAKNPKRKQLLNAIRRQGNFISLSRKKMIRPIRRTKATQQYSDNNENSKEKYVACQDCLGFFNRNYLRRHRKNCALRSKLNEQNREQHLSAAQLFTVCSDDNSDFYSSLRLKNEVFPIMRNDEISKIAMSDLLICSYAESLLRKHKRKQIRNVISNKMRELGRLLIHLKEVTGLQRLFDVMKPQFFDNCVSATKVISGYDEGSRTFKAASLALHMGTTLKQVCDIANKLIIKKSPLFPCPKPEEALKDIKRLKHLFENHWNSEISSLALKNLNENRYQNPTLLPLTKDVMQFQQFVMKEAKNATKALQENCQIKKNYRRLSECVLALMLLLNRKRIGEIQYLKTETYYKTIPQNQQEEFLQTLSETEKMLTRKLKRVVTDGKGSKPVAILFPQIVQDFIEVLSRNRNLCVADSNIYLFANPNTNNCCLNGYHTLKKLADESGVNDSSLFTSTRLRKQIATVLQVINITDCEMEQFAKFMGHTKKTHESYYRLPQDVYQTAKIAKILYAINNGKSSLYKGKSLDEIELSETELNDSNSENENTLDSIDMNDNNHLIDENDSSEIKVGSLDNKNNKRVKEKKRLKKKMRFTDEQKNLMRHYFEENIRNKKPPKKKEVEMFLSKYKNKFLEKNWIKVKAFVYNSYK